MRAPGFWWRRPPSLAARLLKPFGALYGLAAARRMCAPGARAPVPVVCVGNPVAGGAGKTPAALALAACLRRAGRNPVFLTRGYGGRLKGPVRVDLDVHTPGETGDEPRLLAARAPCIVAADRVAGARLAADFGDVVVMDDGFQNSSLLKDVSFLVVDAADGAGNGYCLPAGPLRAPLAAQFARAQAMIVVGEGEEGPRLASGSGLPVLRARLVPDGHAAARLAGRRVLAFAGIGRPRKFARTLRDLGADVARLVEFPDHHVLTEGEADALLAEARRDGLLLVTTEKDRARFARTRLGMAAEVLPVDLVFEDEAALLACLAPVLR